MTAETQLTPDMSFRANGLDKDKPFLQIHGLTKNFGGVQALKGVDLQIHPGEVHGLVGANGAGKSTLIRILAGVTQRGGGEILLDSNPIEIPDPQSASRFGFNFIHQELNLVPKFNVMQNMTLGLPKSARFGLINWRAVQKDVERVAERVGIEFPLDTPLTELSVAEQWLVSIGRALVRRARLIAMDEPTASLSEEEARRLFQIVRELSADGIGILYVSHRLDEIIELCDGITVFKDGRAVMNTQAADVTKQDLVRAIVGGEIAPTNGVNVSAVKAPVVLETRNLSRGRYVRDVSFSVHKGEVLGFGGLVGAGRTELARILFGADKPESGEIFLEDKRWVPGSPDNAVKSGLGFVPEERRSQGLVLDKSVKFNMNLPSLSSFRISPVLPLQNETKATNTARQLSERLLVKTPSVETTVGELSGGNQQKVVIAKWISRDLKLLILDEPSRGVDVGARSEIHKIIRELAARGISVIVISSEVEELPGLCDRVLVMTEGRIVGSLVGDEITKESILHLSYMHSKEAEEVHV